MKQPTAARRQTLICSLVIALTLSTSLITVITTVQCTSIGAAESHAHQSATTADVSSEQKVAPSVNLDGAKPIGELQAKSSVLEPAVVAPISKPVTTSDFGKPAAAAAAASEISNEQEANARRGRSEAPPSSATEKPAAAKPEDKVSTSKPAEQKASGANKPSGTSKQQMSGKSGASGSTNKKLPANLGTVTSTGSGGPAHYMSKHDAYSAIAEKHGALAQDAMRKADKRQHGGQMQRFGGIQKASGLGDMMSPFKGVTDSGLARTLGASVRSIMKGKYSVPAYVASAVLGAVALMAFYESPISPLPVPPLPEPPVGRFPPEMPNISPNLAVPFRMNNQQQQQNQGQYGQSYQRSYQAQAGGQQQPGQILFPGATAQQRQTDSEGPVQQLAANLISSVGANRQTAQRKSSPDYDLSSSRSLFGSSAQQQALANGANAKISSPANNQQHHKAGAASSILSFFGLGGNSQEASAGSSAVSSVANAALNSLDVHRASSGLGGHQIAGSEQKGQAALSNSHLVNKMKSYFDRPLGHNIWPVEHYAPNQYDQYRRMSIVQALAKDTAFLSSFFSPSRRSSNATVTVNQLQQSINNVLAAATGSSSPTSQQANVQQAAAAAAARMQVDQPILSSYMSSHQQQQPSTPIVNTKRASSGYGLMRAADKIGHALLETFTSGLLHRSSQQAAQVDQLAARKSEEQREQNAIASATSLLSDIMSSYNAQQQPNNANQATGKQPSSSQQEQTSKSQVQLAQQTSSQVTDEQVQGRSAEQSPAIQQLQPSASSPVEKQAAIPISHNKSQSQSSQLNQATASASESNNSNPAQLVRKTRSIGLDYPMDPTPPSRASQINNLVDMVSDSYKQNKLLFSFVMNQVGLSHALPYVDQFLGTPNKLKEAEL